MNYQLHYDNLINRAKSRIIDGYVERHHATPKCMGGTDEQDNIVKLTAEEHYLAHLLLVKINVNNDKVIYAANMMTWDRHGKHSNNKRYGWLKRLFSKEISAANKRRMEDVCFKDAAIARLNTPEAKAKCLGAVRSPKERARRSAIFNDPVLREKKLSALNSPESKAKSAASVRTPEIRKKRSILAKLRMSDPDMIVKTHNPESNAKRSKSCKASWTDDMRKKKSESSKKNWENQQYREKMSIKRKEEWANPLFREKMLLARQASRTAKHGGVPCQQ
jgi:hypothetical protein